MLSPAEADLVRRDARLPGLAALLDSEAFLAALKAAAPEAALRAAHRRYLRYKPGQNCLAAYTLDVNAERVECHVKAYRSTDGAKLAKARQRPASAGPLGRGRFLWPECGIEVCVFPNDNKVKALAPMADAAWRENFLRSHLPDYPDLWRSDIRPLAYKPQRRWVGAIEVGGCPKAVCKLHDEAAFDSVRAKSTGIRPGDVLRVAPLLGLSKGRRALFFGWQDGRLLSERLLEPEFDPADLKRVGIALAELHRQNVSLPLRSRRAEAELVLALGDWLAFLLPETDERMRNAARTLARSISEMPQRDAVIHGDFYARQVLLRGEAVTLLDLDEAVRGDRLSDLGTFLAHLECEVVGGRLKAARGDEFREALLSAYHTAAGDSARESLHLQIAAKLFARMPHFFRTCDLDWPALTEATLTRLETLLTKAGKPSGRQLKVPLAKVSGASVPWVRLVEPDLPKLSRALDPELAGAWLTAALRANEAGLARVSVCSVQLRRHKPGRRALIEYGLNCRYDDGRIESMTVLGKLRRRGVDVENLKLLEQLLAVGFSAESQDQISVPQVLGPVPQLGMWLQQKINGQAAAELLPTPAGSAVARRAAEAVCKLHRSKLPVRRVHTTADELSLLQERLNAVAAQRLAWQDRLARLFTACTQLARNLPSVSLRPIHRDFYHDQVLLDGQRVWLTDLDLMCAGDPALDAGNFIGHLLEWAARSPAEQPGLEDASAAFRQRFLELAVAGDGGAIESYTTLTLARHIFISMQFPDRIPFTETILNLCEERCALARTVVRGAAYTDATI